MPLGEEVSHDPVDGRAKKAVLERGFLQAALDCIIIADSENCVVEFNPSAEETFGYSREEALGRPLTELIVPPSLRDLHRRAFDTFVRTRSPTLLGQRVEIVAMRADGTEFPVELALSQIEGEPLLICGAIRDLSTEKQLREELRQLADEQAALRHVATLVAKGEGPTQVFSAVAEGIAHLLKAPGINMIRFDEHSVATKTAGWGLAPLDVGSHWNLDDPSVMGMVARAGRPARIESYADTRGPFSEIAVGMGITSGIGAPIIVDGATWGVIIAYMVDGEHFPEHAETRLFRFTELVATAISNMQALDDLHNLVHEQTALRRVATLVARETGLEDVIDAVCAAVVELFHPSDVTVIHYPLGMDTRVLRTWTQGQGSDHAEREGDLHNIHTLESVVRGTLSPSRIVQRDEATKQPSTVIGAPVVVGNGLWGTLFANSDGILPIGSEATFARLAEMIATAVTNMLTRAQLVASRARIVAAGDEAQKKVQRNIHDGAQQLIVASVIDLQLADERFESDPGAARSGLRSALKSSQAGLEDLRQVAAGLHPRILARGGLVAALESIASKCRIPVSVQAPTERYPSQVEAAAYFVVAEGLANVTKHAQASRAQISVEESGGQLVILVEDDGLGTAEPDNGTGLLGLVDRTEALGGHLQISSRPGEGTTLRAWLPLHTD